MKLFYRPPEIWNRPLVGGVAQVEDHCTRWKKKREKTIIDILKQCKDQGNSVSRTELYLTLNIAENENNTLKKGF